MFSHLHHILNATRIWVRVCIAALCVCVCVPLAVGVAQAAANDPPLSLATHAEDGRKIVKIAVLAFRGEAAALKKWQPTADYLSSQIAGHVFHIAALSLPEMMDVVERGSVDFMLTNPGNYVEHEARNGAVRIATLKPIISRAPGNKIGAVIFARADREDIKTLKDLRGKRFMAINEDAFGGFQMAWREMQSQGVDPFSDLGALHFAGFPQDQVVEAVLSGAVDAATCRAGVLENLADDDRFDFHDIRILNPQTVPGFPYALSTQLYPEWPFAQLRHTSESLSQQVVVALLSMGAEHPAAQSGGYAGWTVPLDYQPVHELFRELRIGPYGLPVDIRFSDLAEQYWQWALFAGVLIGIGILWMVRIEHLVAQRTAELSAANAELENQIHERKRAEDMARERQNELAHVSRVNTMGELTASLAHEINQPLAAITNYATGSVRRLAADNIDFDSLKKVLSTIAREAERAGEVIRRVRTFVRKGEVTLVNLDLNAVVREAVEISAPQARRHGAVLTLELDAGLPSVLADKVQVEQVLLNLIGNAMEAFDDDLARPRTITIATTWDADARETVCTVSDSGSGLPGADSDKIFEAFYSTKTNGMGMGLSISRSIIEASGGRLWGEAGRHDGATFAFALPGAPVLDQADQTAGGIEHGR